MNKPVLECIGIAAGYVKGLNILNGIDLTLGSGEIVSIIGPNGAGTVSYTHLTLPTKRIV